MPIPLLTDCPTALVEDSDVEHFSPAQARRVLAIQAALIAYEKRGFQDEPPFPIALKSPMLREIWPVLQREGWKVRLAPTKQLKRSITIAQFESTTKTIWLGPQAFTEQDPELIFFHEAMDAWYTRKVIKLTLINDKPTYDASFTSAFNESFEALQSRHTELFSRICETAFSGDADNREVELKRRVLRFFRERESYRKTFDFYEELTSIVPGAKNSSYDSWVGIPKAERDIVLLNYISGYDIPEELAQTLIHEPLPIKLR